MKNKASPGIFLFHKLRFYQIAPHFEGSPAVQGEIQFPLLFPVYPIKHGHFVIFIVIGLERFAGIHKPGRAFEYALKEKGISFKFVLIAIPNHKRFRDIHRVYAKRGQFSRIKGRSVIAIRNVLKRQPLDERPHGRGYFRDVDGRAKDKGVACVDFLQNRFEIVVTGATAQGGTAFPFAGKTTDAALEKKIIEVNQRRFGTFGSRAVESVFNQRMRVPAFAGTAVDADYQRH
jgi:hypothetical protein